MKNGKYKILCFSGGGSRGKIITQFLSYVSKGEGVDLCGVDAIGGASIGGIIATVLSTGCSFTKLNDSFTTLAKNCFKKRLAAKLWPLACPTYDNSALDGQLEKMIGKFTVGDIKTVYPDLNYVVGTLNITNDDVKVYDNIVGKDDNVKLVDIAGQTSAAPSYFYCRNVDGCAMIDYGLIDNFCMLTTVTALRAKLGIELKDMDILILGCGTIDNTDKITPCEYDDFSSLELLNQVIIPYTTEGNQLAQTFWMKHLGFNSAEYFNPVIVQSDDMASTAEFCSFVKQCDANKDAFIATWNTWLNS